MNYLKDLLNHAKLKALELDPEAVRFVAPIACVKCGTYDKYVNCLKCCECKKINKRNLPKKGVLIGSRYYTESGQKKAWLSYKDLEDIIRMREDNKMSIVAIAKAFGVARNTIWTFLTKRSHPHFYQERNISITDIDDIQNRALQLMMKKRA